MFRLTVLTSRSTQEEPSIGLIARARSGDDEAFRLIFNRFARPIISFIYDMVGKQETAEELTQETFVRAYRSLSTLKDDTKISTWLFGIAKNVVRESRRSLAREVDDSHISTMRDETQKPEENLLEKELDQVIKKALEKLDQDKRLVFTLKVFQQLSYEEIATITGYSIPKLKTDLHRAKAEMRRLISPYYGARDEL
ncbi:MAG: sigma-70 family RNA polymerase sigma factor [Blastocatellia bacterium]|nr:sigma-70 family RNA polymerase sigma factor [Blastocatellia bacterium]